MKIYFVIFLGLVLSSCGYNAEPDQIITQTGIEGNIQSSRQYSSDRTYSFELKVSPFNPKTQEICEEMCRAVMVTDDTGWLRGVVTITCPADIRALTEVNSEVAFDYLDTVCKNALFESIMKSCPEMTVKYEENLILDSIGPTKFLILSIPSGSYLKDAVTGKHCDCNRAYLISFYENNIVIINSEETKIGEDFKERIRKDPTSSPELLEKFSEKGEREKILKEASSIRCSYRKEPKN